MCKENLSFMIKYLKTITYESGLRPLISDSILHASLYKHLHFKLLNDNNNVKLIFSVSYMTSNIDKKNSLDGAL